jgi:dUTP pyrophosphatase
MSDLKLRYCKLWNDCFDLAFATEQSACFDIKAYFGSKTRLIDAYDKNNGYHKLLAGFERPDAPPFVLIPPNGIRVLIPTGIVLDIPEGYSVRLHARSGLAIKGGIVLANAEGVIDSDYTNQLMVAIMNLSDLPMRITHGDRICQGEMVPVLKYSLEPTYEIIPPKTSRSGGFGSTGVS